MANRITVTIAGQNLTLLADESEEYMRKVALLVDEKIREAGHIPNLVGSQASLLAGVNLADELLKAQAQLDDLRHQLKDCLDENGEMRMKLNQVKNRR